MEYERAIAHAARVAYVGKPTTARDLLVVVEIAFGLQRSKSNAKLRGETRAKKCDVDGVKAVLDALNGIVYEDDSQIETLISRKRAREGNAVGDVVTVSIFTARTEGDK